MFDETFHAFDRKLSLRWQRAGNIDRLLVAHVTDSHVLSGAERCVGVVEDFPSPTWGRDRLADVVRELRSFQKTPDLLVLGGDMTQTGHAAEWDMVFETLAPVKVPVLVTLGNQEHRNNVVGSTAFESSIASLHARGFKDGQVKDRWAFSEKIGGYRFVGLDSLHCGTLGAGQHEFLRSELANGDATILVVHRPTVCTGHFVDERRLIDPTFETILRDYPNVAAVVCGHAHRHCTQRQEGRLHLVTPAVNFGNHDRTGYRLFCLANGKVSWSTTRFPAGLSCHSFRGSAVEQAGGALWEEFP